jgi:hypothetical protein
MLEECDYLYTPIKPRVYPGFRVHHGGRHFHIFYRPNGVVFLSTNTKGSGVFSVNIHDPGSLKELRAELLKLKDFLERARPRT